VLTTLTTYGLPWNELVSRRLPLNVFDSKLGSMPFKRGLDSEVGGGADEQPTPSSTAK
jgi:hypothetical protein